ncbi:MAG: hypothetical protein AB3N33_04600 [Puniceicoccaceae bacterium]
MKRWIAKQWIAASEIFGWNVPAWVRRLIPSSEFEQQVSLERELTESLKNETPRDFPEPAFLEQRIERAVVESGQTVRPGWRWIDLLVPSSAFAMAVVVGFVMLSRPDAEQQVDIPSESPELAVVETVPETGVSPRTLTRIGEGLSTLEQGLIMKPLESEQKRLAADVAGALKFVSRSILPDAYADGVNSRLDSLKEEVSRSI